ncbi:MAG TPA: DUF503 domain-containing protein [Bacillota bacterium]|mgnify:CR=1 FL=1|jgi:uncharacterized protein YlxP (DUF503 family)|nr:DUF503 domain-containing protein [Fastidiosipila sp.]HPX93388.1 DUF503 domain-containing protein [Bacillota bacterium]HQB80474.1 DUF503 domain-containing protein [Bacillota bacterium]
MNVLIIETIIDLPWCHSLKDKRRVRQSLIDRLEKRHRLSVKEIDCQDMWKTLCLGMAAVVLSEGGGRTLEQSIRTTIEEHSNGDIQDWKVDLL